MDFQGLTAAERLIAEQAVLGYREVHRAMKAAPHGCGVASIEQAVVAQMRQRGAAVMEEALREAAAVEKKGAPLRLRTPGRVPGPGTAEAGEGGRACPDDAAFVRLPALRAHVDAAGRVGRRGHGAPDGRGPATGVPGGDELVVRQRQPSPGTFTGLSVSDQTIRRVAEAEGVKVQAWQELSSQATGPVACAEGNAEFLTDGAMVNTTRGWQEVRLSIFSRRAPGDPVDPAAFTGLDGRGLPRPAAQLVLVSKQGSREMGRLWARVAGRLGWDRGRGVSAISDGARWIAAEEERELPLAERVVDVYHVSEHLHRCAAALHGEGTGAAREWAGTHLVRLVKDGAAVLLWTLGHEARSAATPSARAAVEALLNYPRPNRHALGYAQRLRRGQPMGSGQVEGACKTVIGRRLKLNSARWTPSNIAPVASLCAVDHSNLWTAYWSARAA